MIERVILAEQFFRVAGVDLPLHTGLDAGDRTVFDTNVNAAIQTVMSSICEILGLNSRVHVLSGFPRKSEVESVGELTGWLSEGKHHSFFLGSHDVDRGNECQESSYAKTRDRVVS